jgi:hypothetical protein
MNVWACRKNMDRLEDFLRDAIYDPENIFVEGPSRHWPLAALIDFGDVMAGWGEYDLLGPSMFASRGIRLRSLLRGADIRRRTQLLHCPAAYDASSSNDLERLLSPID